MEHFLILNAVELGTLYLIALYHRRQRARRAAHTEARIRRVKEASYAR